MLSSRREQPQKKLHAPLEVADPMNLQLQNWIYTSKATFPFSLNHEEASVF